MRWRCSWRSSAPARRPGTPAAALLGLASLLLATVPVGPPSAPVPDAVPGTDGVLTVSDVTEVSGVETYDTVRVLTTGTLVIPLGASLVATSMTMEGDSRLEMTGGTLLLRAGPGTGGPSLVATCQHVDLTGGSTIRVEGGDGTAEVDASAGSPALVSISARTHVTVDGSDLEVVGGDGLSPGEPLSGDGLLGDHCSGRDGVQT